MIYFITILVLSGLLSGFVSGNNLSAAVGNIIGSRIVSRDMGLIVGILGFSLGLLIEGHLLILLYLTVFPMLMVGEVLSL